MITPPPPGRGRRPVWLLLAVAAAGCSGSDVSEVPTSTSPPATSIASTPSPVTTLDAPAASPEAFRVVVAVEPIDGDAATLDVAIDPPEGVDPFGTFASCSGFQRSVAAYSFAVADPAAPVVSVGAFTLEPVAGAGVYDADVRVELGDGTVRQGPGTITLDAGLRAGEFTAFDADGTRISGSFECQGGPGAPAPLVPGGDDDVLDTVQVFTLMRAGDAERVVGLAVDASSADATCRGAVGGTGTTVVRVDGDRSIGAMTTFELTDGERATMRARVGSVTYELSDVELALDDRATAGTFRGTTVDGVTIDGAFRCT